MARAPQPDTASSEFSIMLRDNSDWLSPKGSDKYGYAVFAQVVEGWNVIQNIMTLPSHNDGNGLTLLDKPVKILGAHLADVIVPLAWLKSSV